MVAATKAVMVPMVAMTIRAPPDIIGKVRATRYTPAATMVAA